MRPKDAGSIYATCSRISIRISFGTFAMGHGGAGSPSIKGSAWGIGKLAKDRISSGVGKISISSVLSFVNLGSSAVEVATG